MLNAAIIRRGYQILFEQAESYGNKAQSSFVNELLRTTIEAGQNVEITKETEVL